MQWVLGTQECVASPLHHVTATRLWKMTHCTSLPKASSGPHTSPRNGWLDSSTGPCAGRPEACGLSAPIFLQSPWCCSLPPVSPTLALEPSRPSVSEIPSSRMFSPTYLDVSLLYVTSVVTWWGMVLTCVAVTCPAILSFPWSLCTLPSELTDTYCSLPPSKMLALEKQCFLFPFPLSFPTHVCFCSI